VLKPRTAGSTRVAHPALIWVLRLVRGVQLAMVLCFVVYFLSVQVNAVAYLTGRHRPLVGGATPAVPLDGAAAAVADIVVGLAFEAIAALIVFVVVAVIRKR